MVGERVDLFRFAHEHRGEVVWMSQNTNTIPLNPSIKDAILTSTQKEEYHLYPYKPGVFGLTEAIRNDLSIDGFDVFLTNGGIEALYSAQRALLRQGDEVVTTDPSFLPIHKQAGMSGAKVVEVPIYGEPWKLTVDAVEREMGERTKALLIIDPHNPLGIGYTAEELKGLSEVAEDRGLYLLHDITYGDFNDGQVLATEFYPEKTLLFYSFSKGAGLAGMRIGALIGTPQLVERVRHFDTNILGVNVLAQRAALASLRGKDDWLPRLREICGRNQAVIRGAVERVDGAFLPVYPSKGNMFIIDVQDTGVDPGTLEERMLLEHRVHVRAGYYLSERFGQNFIRVSFSVPPEQCDRFPRAFTESVEALRT
ncbi:MAG: pyridoxal phosphate-dependent aminotransferase [Candidatus Thermoplasmatota archaeon]|nr:pyridoxal phosphate-dependent aminotransferase [Candidatus Thermoplasmatota archaeon]